MQSKCMYLRFRKKQGKAYCYCIKKRSVIEVSSCCGCVNREYKKTIKMTVKTKIRPISKTNKVVKATSIPKEVKMIVWERDKHRCIFCHKPVDWNYANSHYIKRSQLGMGIPKNIMTNCERCHKLFEESSYREEMKKFAKNHFMNEYEDWNEKDLVYKKGLD